MIERSEIQFGLTPIPFLIRRSDRSETVALTIEKPGKLVVTAPEGVTIDRLNGIVRHKAPWVLKKIRMASDRPLPPSDREFVTGETVLYLGRQFRLKVIDSDHTNPRIWAGRYEVPVPASWKGIKRRREVRRKLAGSLKERADLYLPDRLADVCKRLPIEKPSIVVREQAKRWGSGDSNGVLRINWRIVQAPIPLIDYVLVHELVHLEHPNHDRGFWAAVGHYMPDYESRRSRLKELGASLVW